MAILNPTKAEAVEALTTLRFYYLNLYKDTPEKPLRNRRLKTDYAEKAYDFEVSAKHLEKYGP